MQRTLSLNAPCERNRRKGASLSLSIARLIIVIETSLSVRSSFIHWEIHTLLQKRTLAKRRLLSGRQREESVNKNWDSFGRRRIHSSHTGVRAPPARTIRLICHLALFAGRKNTHRLRNAYFTKQMVLLVFAVPKTQAWVAYFKLNICLRFAYCFISSLQRTMIQIRM